MTKLLSNIYHLTIENQLIVLASGCLPHIVHQERCWSAPNFSARGPGESSSHFPPLCKLCLVAYFWNIVVPTYRKRSLDSNRDPMHCSTPGFPVQTNSRNLLKLKSIESVMPSNHLILCCSLLLPPSIFPSIRVFSNESVLCIRWPKLLELQLQDQSFQWIFRVDFL